MKRFKTKRQMGKNRILIFIIFCVLFFLLFIWISFKKFDNSHYQLVEYLINNSDFKQDKDISYFKITNLDYLLASYAFKEEKNVFRQENTQYIYLYNTHDTENYQDNTNIYYAGESLQNNLKRLGISSILEDKKTSDYLITGMNYYQISRNFIYNVQKKENNIAYYLDLHRDSVSNTKVIIDGKAYAKVLFVLGLENANYAANKKVMERMHQYLEENYKGLSKGILEKAGKDVNGIYNQDLGSNVLLIEIGGVENTKEEVERTTEALALMLYHELNG